MLLFTETYVRKLFLKTFLKEKSHNYEYEMFKSKFYILNS